MEHEEWRQIEAHPDYAVSSYGDVMSLRTKKLRKVSVNQQGIAKVTLREDGVLLTRSIAVLVGEAFLPLTWDTHNSFINLDGNRSNNMLDNLMRRPRWFAVKYHLQFKDPIFFTTGLNINNRTTGERFESFREPCVKYGVLYKDIQISYVNGDNVFPTEHNYRSSWKGGINPHD